MSTPEYGESDDDVGDNDSTLAIGAEPGPGRCPDCVFDHVISPISEPPVIRGVIGRGSPVTRGEMGR